MGKKGKVDNKRSKKRSEDSAVSSGRYSTDTAISNTLGETAVSVPLSSNLIKETSARWSWSRAFAAAAQVKPKENLDEEFLRRTADTTVEPGLVLISQLAQKHSAVAPAKHLQNSLNESASQEANTTAEQDENRKLRKEKKKRKREAQDETKRERNDEGLELIVKIKETKDNKHKRDSKLEKKRRKQERKISLINDIDAASCYKGEGNLDKIEKKENKCSSGDDMELETPKKSKNKRKCEALFTFVDAVTILPSHVKKSEKADTTAETLNVKENMMKQKSDDDGASGFNIDATNDEGMLPNNSPKAAASLKDQMIPVKAGNAPTDTMPVMIDRTKGIAFSGLDRTETGDEIVVGNVGVDGHVVIDSTAVRKAQEFSATKGSPSFPFLTHPDDHCESPINAYQDIEQFLKLIAVSNSQVPADLAIYDPYYCNGSAIKNLSDLGFSNVHNKKEDCYKVWSSDTLYPQYDVLITNPPYSGDHIDRLVGHVTSEKVGIRPWFLLLPTWVHKRDVYLNAMKRFGINPFYLVPKKRYIYVPPNNFRDKKASDVHKKSSPFVSMWYIWGGTSHMTDAMVKAFQRNGTSTETCDLARSKNALRDLRRKGRTTHFAN